jgi:hypothetical protein
MPCEGTPESARALLTGTPAASRRCPAPGCSHALTGRQSAACSAKCRAELSRGRQAAQETERRHETLELVSTAEEALAAIRRRLIAGS